MVRALCFIAGAASALVGVLVGLLVLANFTFTLDRPETASDFRFLIIMGVIGLAFLCLGGLLIARALRSER